MKSRRVLFLIVWLMGILPCALAQDSTAVKADTTCIQQDLSDVVRDALNKQPKAKTAGSLLLLPIIGSNPANRFLWLVLAANMPFERLRVPNTPSSQEVFNSLPRNNSFLWSRIAFIPRATGFSTVVTGGI